MTINRATFFSYVRAAPFGGSLKTAQVQGMEAILDYWETSGRRDDRHLAYVLATAFHETGATMQPVRETFAKSDAEAIANLDKAYSKGKLKGVRVPYWRDGWFGRGFVQLTHKDNYVKMGKILGISLAENPSLALDLKTSVAIIFEGMSRGLSNKGDFTGKALEDYFNETTDDPIEARRIVNRTDKAELIAGYHKMFLGAIQKANEVSATKQLPQSVEPQDAKPDDVPPSQSGTAWTTVVVPAASAVAVPIITGINNVYALAFSLALLALAGLAGFMFISGRWQINRTKALK